MRSVRRVRVPGGLVVALFLAGLWADVAAAWPYFGVGLTRNEVNGEFDDSVILIGPGAVFDVPTVDPGFGPRFVLGWGRGSGSFEFSYTRSEHKAPGALNPEGYDAEYHLFGFDFVGRTGWGKSLTADKGQAYLRLGIATATLRLDQSGFDTALFDVEYLGAGFTTGLGFEVRLPRRFNAYGEYDYRFNTFNHVQSRGAEEIEIEDSLRGWGPSMLAGLNWGL